MPAIIHPGTWRRNPSGSEQMAVLPLPFHSAFRSSTRPHETSACLNPVNPISERLPSLGHRRQRRALLCPAAALKVAADKKPLAALKVPADKKPAICTSDELHYVDVPNSDWRLALWRYLPSPLAPQRSHPLLLLSGIGSNAIGYDLSPEDSFARYMAGQGYDTWTVELRGAGLSTPKMDPDEANGRSEELPVRSRAKEMALGSWQFDFTENFAHPSHRSGSAEDGNNFFGATQMRDFIQKLLNVVEGVEGSSPRLFSAVHGHISSSLKNLQKQLDTVVRCNWDFENYLEEDVPAAMEYIRTQSKPKDGKLLAVGHSMGGILLYATLSRCYFEGRDSGLASVATLGSSLDFTSSQSTLKMLLPLVDHARALDVSMSPIGSLVSAVHPFATRLPYASAWLSTQISAPDMMQPELLEKLLLNNFCTTIPFNLLLQLATAFQKQGLCNRHGTLFYKDHLRKSKVPILALAGDQDVICPPEAVYETVKLIPKNLITYKVFGESGGPHFAHYDIVGSHLAKDLVYPCIVEFFNRHDVA